MLPLDRRRRVFVSRPPIGRDQNCQIKLDIKDGLSIGSGTAAYTALPRPQDLHLASTL